MDKISRLLLDIGVPPSLTGFQYLHDAIEYKMASTNSISGIYKQVAEKNGTTSTKAERSMRHAIETAFDRMPPELIEEIFGNTVSASKSRPTNSEFIAVMALHLREEDKPCSG